MSFLITPCIDLEGALCAYVAKEHHKALRREFGIKKTNRRLLAEERSRLKSRVDEVEGNMKEILESVNKLKAEVNEANASKLVFENRAKTAEDQVTLLHR